MASKEYFEDKSKLYYENYLNNKCTLKVRGIIINDMGQILLLHSNKHNGYSIPGGTVENKETIKETVLREVFEETGLDVSKAEGGYVFTYQRENLEEGDNYFVDVYRFTMDFTENDLHMQEAETAGYMLATVEDIAALGAEGIFLHYDSIKQIFI